MIDCVEVLSTCNQSTCRSSIGGSTGVVLLALSASVGLALSPMEDGKKRKPHLSQAVQHWFPKWSITSLAGPQDWIHGGPQLHLHDTVPVHLRADAICTNGV